MPGDGGGGFGGAGADVGDAIASMNATNASQGQNADAAAPTAGELIAAPETTQSPTTPSISRASPGFLGLGTIGRDITFNDKGQLAHDVTAPVVNSLLGLAPVPGLGLANSLAGLGGKSIGDLAASFFGTGINSSAADGGAGGAAPGANAGAAPGSTGLGGAGPGAGSFGGGGGLAGAPPEVTGSGSAASGGGATPSPAASPAALPAASTAQNQPTISSSTNPNIFTPAPSTVNPYSIGTGGVETYFGGGITPQMILQALGYART